MKWLPPAKVLFESMAIERKRNEEEDYFSVEELCKKKALHEQQQSER